MMDMTMPKNILYPVDFSERSHVVWPAVAAMSRQLGAEVTVLHVLDLPEEFGEKDDLRRRAEEKLTVFPAARRAVVMGSPAQSIVRFAEAMEAPLIMMPTRGRTRFRELLLGSVTASVLHDADCPVWTDVHSASAVAHGENYKSLVCAVDMGPQTASVLRTASRYAGKFGATLCVVHSVPGVDPCFPSAAADRAHVFLLDRATEQFPAVCQEAGVELSLQIVEEIGLVEGITGAAVRYGADLLVIGRGVSQGALGRLRTNAHALIRHSPCAVLSV
jgi:nucleotide-binding universal stress UspA family protein